MTAVIAIAIAAIGAWAIPGLPVRHEITSFVPASSDDRAMGQLARDVIDSELSRTIVVAVGATEEREATAGARELADALRGIEGIEWVRSGPPAEIEAAFYELYFARRYAFFDETPQAARARLSDRALEEAALELRAELSGPTAVLIRQVAREDPLLAFASHLRRLEGAAQGGPRVLDGQLVSADGWGLVLLATRGSTFSTSITGPILAQIDAAIAAIDREHEHRLSFEQAGLHRFAVRAEAGIRSDVQWISTLSSLAVVVIFLVLYRGPRFLVLGAIPLAAGTVLASAACRLLFGGVHGITLAFGSSLLGVGIDYVSHYVNHHVLEPDPAGPEATMKKLWPGLALGAGTTIAGLAGLGWTSFPGMHEIAVFAAVGVTAALFATRVMVPPWMPDRSEAPRATRALAALCARIWAAMQSRRAPALGLGLGALVICAIGLPNLRWIDDIRALNQADPALLEEDLAVRARIAQGEAGRFVIASGSSEEAALEANDRAYAVLAAARERGELRAFRSIHPMLRAASLQASVERAVIESPALGDRMLAALGRAGFAVEMFDPFRASLVRHEPLRWDELAASRAIDLVRPFRAELGDGRIAYLSFVEGVRDPAALRAELEAIEGAAYFDQSEFLTAAYRSFRTRTIELLAIGLLVVLGMCIARYRSLRLGLASIAPAILAAATTLALLGIAGEPANLMHLVGALLVLSMGEDYAVFLIESRDQPEEVASTMVGIAVACATTVISFGLLAASSHPAMRALGLMASIGVGLSMVFAPLALLAVAPRPRVGP